MTIYVDSLHDWGWKLRGHLVKSCHMFTDSVDLSELHKIANQIGMKRTWFQNKEKCPHYDLTESRRVFAIKLGAIEVDHRTAALLWRERRQKLIDIEKEFE